MRSTMKIEIFEVRAMINEVAEELDSNNAYGDGVREALNRLEQMLDGHEIEIDEELY
jgi:hypothetical protein